MYTRETLSDKSMAELVSIYEEVTGRKIKKFSRKLDGVNAILKGQDQDQVQAQVERDLDETHEEVDTPKPPKVKRESAQLGRTHRTSVLLQGKDARTVEELAEYFDTKTRNIAGDLFMIRKHPAKYGVPEGHVLKRDGKKYKIEPK